jgi:hypothetical protein
VKAHRDRAGDEAITAAREPHPHHAGSGGGLAGRPSRAQHLMGRDGGQEPARPRWLQRISSRNGATVYGQINALRAARTL